MKVGDLIENLSKFNTDMNVTISDGFGFHFYSANDYYDFVVSISEVDASCVDIGVGGCEETDE